MLSCIHSPAAEKNDKVGLITSRERFPELANCRDAEAECQAHLTGLLPKLAKRLGVPRLEYKSLLNQGDFLIEVDSGRTDIPKVEFLLPPYFCHASVLLNMSGLRQRIQLKLVVM